MSLRSDSLLKALEAVHLPAEGMSLVASNRLSKIVIDDFRVMLAISIDPSEASAMEAVRLEAEETIKKLVGPRQVLVSLTTEPRAQAKSSQKSPAIHLADVKFVIAVASGKGGVGKSTTAVNVALGLVSLGLKVGLLDADIYGPSIPKLLALHDKPSIVEGRIMAPLEKHGLKIMSIGFLVEETTPMIWRGPMVISALRQMLTEVTWGELDILVIDMPPGTVDAQLSLAQNTPLAGAVIVSTPQDLALIDARRGVAMFQRVEVPILGIVENMASFCCPHCGQKTHIFGHGGAKREADSLGVSFLGEVPLDMMIRETSDSGMPVIFSAPDSQHAKIYKDISAKVWENLQNAKRAFPEIIFE